MFPCTCCEAIREQKGTEQVMVCGEDLESYNADPGGYFYNPNVQLPTTKPSTEWDRTMVTAATVHSNKVIDGRPSSS
jgi:hypothetical protein